MIVDNVVWIMLSCTGHAKKSNPLGKLLYLWNCCRLNLQHLQMRIQTTFSANFNTIADVVQ